MLEARTSLEQRCVDLLDRVVDARAQAGDPTGAVSAARRRVRLRPMRSLKRLRSARVISAGHALVQNLRRGHYELGVDIDRRSRLITIFAELAFECRG